MESLSIVQSVLIALGSTALLFTLVIQAGAYRVLSKRSKPNEVLPSISILKPLKGADEQT